jgi:CrcB protein
MQVEIVRMLDARQYGLASLYATVSVVTGYAAVQIATAVTRRVRVRL